MKAKTLYINMYVKYILCSYILLAFMCLNMFEVFRNVEFRISEIMVFYSILQFLTSYEIV